MAAITVARATYLVRKKQQLVAKNVKTTARKYTSACEVTHSTECSQMIWNVAQNICR